MFLSSGSSKLLNSLTALIGRLVFGGLMIYSHGWGKFLRYFGDDPIRFRDPLGIGSELSFALVVFAELVCAGLLILGLFTRLATIPLIITMIVAAFIVHMDDPFNKIEFASLYLTGFVMILLLGPGKFSLDAALTKKKI